jgi:hypothetical protein
MAIPGGNGPGKSNEVFGQTERDNGKTGSAAGTIARESTAVMTSEEFQKVS